MLVEPDVKAISKRQYNTDGLKVARNVYKARKLHICKLQNKYLKAKIREREKLNENLSESDATSEQESTISDKDTAEITTMASASEPTEQTIDWGEVEGISKEKRQEMNNLYGESSSRQMDIEDEEEFQFPRRTSKAIMTNHIRQTKITNKYGALERQEQEQIEISEVQQQQQAKKKWIPPIIINTLIMDHKKSSRTYQKHKDTIISQLS